jgi:hypothetical protein
MAGISIFTDLASGKYDAQLEALSAAIRARRKYLSVQKGLASKAELSPGDKVAITGNISPKYLIGVTGTVSRFPARRAGDVQVDIDEAYHQRVSRYGTSVGVPASCLAKTV